MPIYEFEDEQGERVELFFPMIDVPRLGSWIEHEGRALRRIIEAPQLHNSKGGMKEFRLHSEAAPPLSQIQRWEAEARRDGKAMPARAKKYDEKGRACFASLHELNEYAKRDGRYGVGSPIEVAQEHANAVHTKRHNEERFAKECERQAKTPTVKA